MDYQKSNLMLHIGMIGGAVICLIGLSIGTSIALVGNLIGALGLIAMLAGIGQAFVYYKCPNCKAQLPIRGKKPNHCPNCGHKLDL